MNVTVPCHEAPSTRGLIISTRLKLAALLICGLMGAGHGFAQTTNVYVDPSSSWIGYMNVFTLPPDVAYEFGSPWATADLNAGFTGAIFSFSPNTSEDRDNPNNAQFWNGDGTPNAYMDANFYVESDALGGQTVTFSGYVWTNSLVTPYSTNVTAFIKDFVPNYSSSISVTTNLTTNGFFTITLATTPGDHIQYGFEMIGPDARISNAVANGSLIVSSNPAPAGPAITSITPSPIYVNLGTTTTLSVTATGSGLTYQWQKNGVNLTNGPGIAGATSSALTLTNVQGNAEANYTVKVVDSAQQSSTASTYLIVFDPANLSFDPHANFNGYINASANVGGAVGSPDSSFSYPVPRLRAGVTNGTAYMQPNIDLYNATDPFWSQGDGTPGQWVEEDFFIANDALAGQVLTFSGYCPSNSLPAPYVETAWIEDFASDYSSFNSITTNLIAGQPFSITLTTGTDPGRHIQYGLRVFGLDNPPSDPDTATAVLVTPMPPMLSATVSNNAMNLSFSPTTPGHDYTIQYKTSLTDPTWQNLSTVSGTATPETVSDSTAPTTRFYRVYVQ